MKILAQNLFTLRKLKGWSRRVIAEELDIKTAAYQSYEEDRANPPLELLIKIADLHGLTLDELVRKKIKIGIK